MALASNRPGSGLVVLLIVQVAFVPLAGAGDGLSFDDPVQLPHDRNAAEPNLAVRPDGTLFVTAPYGCQEKPNAVEGASWLWRSTDDGENWTKLREPAENTIVDEADEILLDPLPLVNGSDAEGFEPFCTGDADVVAAPSGWVHYSDWWIPLAGALVGDTWAAAVRGGNFLVESSPTGADPWAKSPITVVPGRPVLFANSQNSQLRPFFELVSDTRENVSDAFPGSVPTTSFVDRQWLVAGEEGFVGLFYSRFVPEAPMPGAGETAWDHRIEAVYSFDYGATWTSPVIVVDEGPDDFSQISKPVMLPDGRIAMAYAHLDLNETPIAREVRLALSASPISTPTIGITPLDAVRRSAEATADRVVGLVNWTHETVTTVQGCFCQIWAVQTAADDESRVYAGWSQQTSASSSTLGVYAAQRFTNGTWTNPKPVRTTDQNVLPWIDAHGNGQVAVGWYGSNTTAWPEFAGDETGWFPYAAHAHWGDSKPSFDPTRIDDRPAKVGRLCDNGAACHQDRELLDYLSVEFGPNGCLNAAYARAADVNSSVPLGARAFYAREAGC